MARPISSTPEGGMSTNAQSKSSPSSTRASTGLLAWRIGLGRPASGASPSRGSPTLWIPIEQGDLAALLDRLDHERDGKGALRTAALRGGRSDRPQRRLL